MRRSPYDSDISEFDAIRLAIANPEDILEWSYGEVLKPETINYRTQKPERDGLFCEKIFGPVKDINPHDTKFKGMRAREMAVDKNGEIVTRSIVRRERMGHIALAAPVTHIWFLRGTPSAMGLILNITVKNLERVAYFASYIIKGIDTAKRDQLIADVEARYEAAKNEIEQRYHQQSAALQAPLKDLIANRNRELEQLAETTNNEKTALTNLVKYALLSESDYRLLPDNARLIISVGMGAQALKELLEEVDLQQLVKQLHQEADTAKGQRRKKLFKRLKVLEGMLNAGTRPSSMVVTVLPVIPPDLRPMVQLTGGRFATSDLNDLYRRVINRNNRLKKLIELNAPEVIKRNEMRMLQEAVDALIDNNNARGGRAVSSTGGRRRLKSLSDMLKGKQGRFRQNLLGKRVDYSGRSVIVSGPELNMDECGIPKMMALELFKPFVIGHLISNEKAHNIKSATRMIEAGENAVWDALDEVTRDKYVLLNRAPTLHRLGIQAFKPRLIEGKAIQLHPLVCKGFNADFDGDQMAVHLPLAKRAQSEAEHIMSAKRNLLKPADGSIILHIEQDIVLGCYYLTYDKLDEKKKRPIRFSSVQEVIYAYEFGKIRLQTPIEVEAKGQLRSTTYGRIIFNELFPDDFEYQNDAMTKKRLKILMSQIYRLYGPEVTAQIGDDLKDLGFEYATVSGLSSGMDEFHSPESLRAITARGEKEAAVISEQYDKGLITNEERYRLTVDIWIKVDKQILSEIEKYYASVDNATSITVNSGARGNVSAIKQIAGSLGIVADATGHEIELPVRSGYGKGLTPLESFTSTRGTRKGMISTALKTADSGYLTRRLVDVSQDVYTISGESDDPGYAIYRSESKAIGIDFKDRISGRFAAKPINVDNRVIVKKGELITADIASVINDSNLDEVIIMSVLTSKNYRGVNVKSYGNDMATGRPVDPNTPVGVIAAQSIGEPGTQLTLNVFHAGGVAGEDISQGLPRVEELFEARTPKGQAYLSEIDGTVTVNEEGSNYSVQIISDQEKAVRLNLAGRSPLLANGALVTKGTILAATSNGKKPLLSPIDGTIDLGGKQLMILTRDVTMKKLTIPNYKVMIVRNGDRVLKGDKLTQGSVNLHEMMEIKGIEATQRYIMNEVLRIFANQGQMIADKHLEIVVRQMFSRVQIEDSGDSELITGDIVSRSVVEEANRRLKAAGKNEIKFIQLLLGITKVSTWSDSFLSAASFQDTTRVLINAATCGRIDRLRGLKENVIIGRLIPVGTGVETVDD